MIKQKDIKRWIPIADIIFKKYMPIDYFPPVRIGSPKTIMKIREELIEMTQSLQVDPPEPYDSIMEMIHGDNGDAILIQQELLPECYGADNIFCHYYWHELGHYFAIRNECPGNDLHRFNNPGFTDDRAKQKGYWFWSEFIAEAIADHVDELHCRIDNADIYRPETLTWEPELWGCLSERLLRYLELAFEWSITSINEAALAMFFATILMEDATKHYIRAAENAELKVYDQQLRKPVKMKPGSIEPTCISDAPEPYQDILWKMKALLEEQLRKKEFWKIDEDFLEETGQCLLSLLEEKALLEEAEKQHPSEKVIFMNMCMLCDGDMVLALDKTGSNYSGTTFPGGHVEAGETFSEAVIREMQEETGLTIKQPILKGIYHWYRDGLHNVGLLYRADFYEGELKNSEEGQVYWISREEYEKKDLAVGMRRVLQIMDDDTLTECFMDVRPDGSIQEHMS